MTTETETKRYQGWANYETWAVHLWLSNEEDSYHAARAIADEHEDDWDRRHAFREWVTEMVELDEATLRSDLLGAALSEVDWQEVADAFKEEI